MNYKIIIPARGNSKRLPGKNMKLLADKPLIQYSIDYALEHFSLEHIWVNSDDKEILDFAKKTGVQTIVRPNNLATDFTSTVDVLKFQLDFFEEMGIKCDAIILLQPTNPFRNYQLLKSAIAKFEHNNRASLATFSRLDKKIGKIKNNLYQPTNYTPGQRSQDLEKDYFENGQLYITKSESIKLGEIITEDVYPYLSDSLEATVDIDYIEDFIFAESLLKLKQVT
jgi:CMP-N-acetylneuraminic acid synthetase